MAPYVPPSRLSASVYQKAERLLSWNAVKLFRNATVAPLWDADGKAFRYARQNEAGETEWVRVACATGERKPAEAPETLRSTWMDGELPSPDRRLALRLSGHDLVLRDLASGQDRSLTDHGAQHFAWGASPGTNLEPVTQIRSGRQPLPVASWSPNSRWIFTHQLDERGLRDLHYLDSTPAEREALPRLYSFKFSTPADETLASCRHHLFDLDSGASYSAQLPAAAITRESPIERNLVWWAPDSSAVFVIDVARGDKSFDLYRLEPKTGEACKLWTEASPTYVEANVGWNEPIGMVLSHGAEILLLSERDGWMHLWRHDGLTGAVLSQVTRGEWVVREVLRVDEAAGRVFFMASGREPSEDPYFRLLYSVRLDGSDLRLLTPEQAEHDVAAWRPPPFLTWRGYPEFDAPRLEGLSPDADHVVETYGTIRTAPVSVLRRTSDGAVVSVLETVDTTDLEAAGWTWPIPFSAKAADGVTEIHGALWLPSEYADEGSFPVLDSIYPGPQTIRTAKGSISSDPSGMGTLANGAAMASMGFALVTVDGTGGPFRSKAFHDVSYGRLERAGGLEDHIAALRQLKDRFPGLDLERVGIFGFSGGGTATCRALFEYGDFFKAGVAAAGSHDLLGYTAYWGEKYDGLYDPNTFELARNAAFAERFTGRLLLVAGELDDNCHPAMTLQVAKALMDSHKDFDLLIMPRHNHMTPGGSGYFTRRVWDFFVRHLMGLEPPPHYVLKGPRERAD